MKRIPQTLNFDYELSSTTDAFFRRFKLCSVLKRANAYKSRGLPAVAVFQRLFNLAFSNRSLFMELKTGICAYQAGKDTFYRFINSCSVNWMRFTTLLSGKIINGMVTKLTDDSRVNVFIVDDTVYERKRSKKVELLAKVYDHAKDIHIYGFRLLTLGWSDGNTFIPVNGCLLSSKKEGSRICEEREKIDRRSCGFKARKLAQTKAPSVMLEMLDMAVRSGIAASYVLFDSWFCFPSMLLSLKKRGFSVIAMAKKTPKIYYRYKGEMLSVTEIYKMNRKRRGRSKYLLSVEIEVCGKDGGCSVPARLVYVRNRNNSKDYLVFITTDILISEEEVVRIYTKRWDIEVFFKVSKSYLKLAKECRSLSYDAMTAYVAVVFARYMMLAVENRIQCDEKTFGELYCLIARELSDITWLEAFRLLMDLFISTVSERSLLTEKELDALLETFIDALPEMFKNRLLKCA